MKLEDAHLTAQEVEQYRRRTLDPELRRRCDRHISTCQDCLEQVLGGEHLQLASARVWEAFTNSNEEPFHLSADDLQRYAAAKTDEADKAIFQMHLEDCRECSGAYQSLLASKPGPVTIPVRAQAGRERASFWEALRRGWHVFVTPSSMASATALAACLLLTLVLWHQYKLGGNASKGGQASNPTPPNSNSVVVRLRDGSSEVIIDKDGKVAGLERFGPQTQAIVQQALTTSQLSKPEALAELSSPRDKLMGAPTKRPAFSPIAPVGTVVAESQPTLSWEPLTGAESYVVSVFDTEFHNVARSSAISTAAWKLPVPLRRGATYFWQVTALRGRQRITSPVAPAPRAQFKVLDEKSMEFLESVRAQRPDSHLTLGVLYARAGLLQDSERELQALAKQNPDSSTASRLLRCVQGWESGEGLSK